VKVQAFSATAAAAAESIRLASSRHCCCEHSRSSSSSRGTIAVSHSTQPGVLLLLKGDVQQLAEQLLKQLLLLHTCCKHMTRTHSCCIGAYTILHLLHQQLSIHRKKQA
jgi:hypothetical protein